MVTSAAALVLAGEGLRGLNVAAHITDLGRDPVAPQADVVPGRWRAIVIHHSGLPAGSPESIERQHRAWGYASLGYHFVIGNGFDYGNGAVYPGPRWRMQQPGAHVVERPIGAEPNADWFNENAIGICLVGNGEKRGFTDDQVRELKGLIVELQQACGIPDSAVFLHSDLADVASPGRFFPVASVESWLRD
jgi:N-acetylmuramoyl-L-alanine amidase